MDKEIMKGSIDIIILSLIAKKDMYGYDIAKEVKERSNELYEIGEGTLYPALKRLENKKMLESYWGDVDTGGRRKYYRITVRGKSELSVKLEDWNKVNTIINICYEGAR